MQSIVLGGGCFWCLDALYQQMKGVDKVVSGYAGGSEANPTYESIHEQPTGHAEVVEVTFDSGIMSLTTILDVFWATHDPTTPNRQGNDVGPEYRSIVLYRPDQKTEVDAAFYRAQANWDNKVITELKLLEKFYPAEDYHQDYFNKNPEQGYCQIIINPKLAKFRKNFPSLLKS
ncbi:MAG: peptide-methionine (S)-S-oxide reductase MsrA [Patescibacteria group bacterium]